MLVTVSPTCSLLPSIRLVVLVHVSSLFAEQLPVDSLWTNVPVPHIGNMCHRQRLQDCLLAMSHPRLLNGFRWVESYGQLFSELSDGLKHRQLSLLMLKHRVLFLRTGFLLPNALRMCLYLDQS